MAEARAFQRSTRQSPYKMRLVIDQIRGKDVNEALALLKFSKKHAARQIAKLSTDSDRIVATESGLPPATDPIPPDEILNDYFPVRGGGLEPPWLLTASTSS